MRDNRVELGILIIIALVAIIVFLVVRADSADAPPGGNDVPSPAATATPPAGRRSIAEENALPGDDGWRMTARPALAGEIAAYTGQVSVQAGEQVDLYVSASAEGARFDLAVYRMGWYGGAGGRRVHAEAGIEGTNQGRWDRAAGMQECPTCRLDPATLLLEANWERTLQIDVGDDWVSGVYLARLHERVTNTQAYAVFVVRDDTSDAPAIVQLPTNAWQAYNLWGDASTIGSFGADRTYIDNARRAHRVSYDRPYDMMLGDRANYGAGEFFAWEYNFIRWAEARGFEMTYTTSADVHLDADALVGRQLFVSLGHDEYWTMQQRDAVERARDAGTNVAFFGANAAYWQARLEPSSSGEDARVLTAYKEAALDPLARERPREATVASGDPPVSRPQSALTGVSFGANATPEYQAWTPNRTDSWVFAESGITRDDTFPGVVGYEYDHMPLPVERRGDALVIGASSVEAGFGEDTAITSVYTASSGALVFAAGTLAWSWALDDYGHEDVGAFADERLQAVTATILRRLMQSPQASATADRSSIPD